MYNETDKYAEINEVVKKADADQIYEFIARLPAASQKVFNLYFIDGYKHKEIAEMLEIKMFFFTPHLRLCSTRFFVPFTLALKSPGAYAQ